MVLEKYKAVFFDVGGTLIRVHPSVGEVYARHARPFGFAGAAADIDRQFAVEWNRCGGLSTLGGSGGEAAEKEFWYGMVSRVFDHFGDLGDFDTYFDIIYDAFRSGENWRVYEDVLASDLLGTLKRRGVVLGVISNWDSRLFGILENMGLARHFDFILASAVVGSAKPDKKIFSEALRKSGVTPEQACHIGDDWHSDCLGARNSGIDTILIDRKGRWGDEAAPKVRSFLELV
ncbi:MAG: HAD-IA family hydrolase [Nitrospinales bacterium]